MTRVGRAVEKGETQGFMKVVVDAETKQILGAAILGIGGDEAIHGILDMMNAGAPYPVLQWAVPIHPTVSELIPTALGRPEATRRLIGSNAEKPRLVALNLPDAEGQQMARGGSRLNVRSSREHRTFLPSSTFLG